jgi:hypothetical protein
MHPISGANVTRRAGPTLKTHDLETHDGKRMQALFIGQTYIDVTFITDHMPTGDEKHVASAYAVSFGGNAVTAAFCFWRNRWMTEPVRRRAQ